MSEYKETCKENGLASMLSFANYALRLDPEGRVAGYMLWHLGENIPKDLTTVKSLSGAQVERLLQRHKA